jgi:long-chain acyl-CoA synthetase
MQKYIRIGIDIAKNSFQVHALESGDCSATKRKLSRSAIVNSGGENVYPLEVENVLLKHPAVAEVSVVPLPHRVKGEVPVAMVVRAKGRDVSEEELKQFFIANAPAYAHPRRIAFVAELPLNGPGKIDRKAVQSSLSERFGALG